MLDEDFDLSIIMKNGTKLSYGTIAVDEGGDSTAANTNKRNISMMFDMPIDMKRGS